MAYIMFEVITKKKIIYYYYLVEQSKEVLTKFPNQLGVHLSLRLEEANSIQVKEILLSHHHCKQKEMITKQTSIM